MGASPDPVATVKRVHDRQGFNLGIRDCMVLVGEQLGAGRSPT
jgi:hypothetical protein